MTSSSNGSSFLTFHGKKYDPTFDWHDEKGLLQDPKTHAPYSHVDIKVSFSLVSLLRKMLFHVSLKVSMVRYCHFIVAIWDIVCCNVGFGSFLKCYYGSWCNLGNIGGLWNFDIVGKLWCCWMNFGLDFGSIGIGKNLCCRLVWICSWCMWEKFVGMGKLCFMDMAKFLWVCAWINLWVWANFVGMKLLVMENFVAMWCWFMKNFCGYDFGYVRIYLLCMDT